MKISFSRSVIILSGIVGCCLFAGCGPSQKEIDSFESTINSLSEKGTPDSLLSTARVLLSQIKDAKKSGNTSIISTSVQSLTTELAAAKAWYSEKMAATKGETDSLISFFNEQKKLLSGLQQRQMDSLQEIISELVKKNWYIQARDYVVELKDLLPSLLKDEEQSNKVLPLISGRSWKMNNKNENCEGCLASEMKKITLNKDGSFTMDEEMKGQTSPTLKEDWQFVSSGTYALKGDTILLTVHKEKCLRQTYWNLTEKNGKETWVKNDKPIFEKTITDGTKNQFFTFDYLKKNFRN